MKSCKFTPSYLLLDPCGVDKAMSSSFSFSFPKVNRGTSTGSSVKQLACASSFPLVSTNSSKRDSDFLTHENPSSLLKKSRSRNDTFRSRNSFIVARNIITNLMPSDLKTFRDLAKTVSLVSYILYTFLKYIR